MPDSLPIYEVGCTMGAPGEDVVMVTPSIYCGMGWVYTASDTSTWQELQTCQRELSGHAWGDETS